MSWCSGSTFVPPLLTVAERSVADLPLAGPAAGPLSSDDLVAAATARIDAANAIDPRQVADPRNATGDGVPIMRPMELVHAERMTHWLSILAPDASPAQRIAARAHHLERWMTPRSDAPEGRAGYLTWRAAARERHARRATELLTELGVDALLCSEVADIVAKRLPTGSAAAQTHEDALCLVFLELQGAATLSQLGPKADRVLERTVSKMSVRARELAVSHGLLPSDALSDRYGQPEP